MAKNTEKVVSVAILGCGKIAGFPGFSKGKADIFTHLPAYRYFSNVNIVAACDSNKKQASRFCEFYRIPSSYTDLRKMLKDEKVDLLSICTPPDNHYSAIKEAALAGVKHILCEKPLTRTIRDVERIEKLCRDKDISLTVNYLRRYHSEYRKLKRFIEDGKMGKVKKIHCLYTRGLVNNGSHLLDLLLYLFGPVDHVYDSKAIAGKGAYRDISSRLRFKRGFECLIQPMSSLDYSVFEIDVFFEKARVTITDSGRTIVVRKVTGSKHFPDFSILEDYSKKKDCTKMGMVPVIDDLISVMRGRRRKTDPTRDGIMVSRIIDAIKESSSGNGKKVKIKNKGKAI
jgi:predicted dehydrogenase